MLRNYISKLISYFENDSENNHDQIQICSYIKYLEDRVTKLENIHNIRTE
jgi:hypothetical protein